MSKIYLTALAAIFFCACIKDAPPNPEADIESFEVDSSLLTSDVFIDQANRRIMLYLTTQAHASGKATFDFKRAERHFDCGISAGAERSFGARWVARASLSWGLRPVFPSSFKGVSFGMYNIFATLGASYRLFH